MLPLNYTLFSSLYIWLVHVERRCCFLCLLALLLSWLILCFCGAILDIDAKYSAYKNALRCISRMNIIGK